MKIGILSKVRRWNIFFLATVFLLVAGLITGCKKIENGNNQDVPFAYVQQKKELVVMLKPGADESAFNAWLDSIVREFGPVNPPKYCTGCDNRLMLLTGAGIVNYVNQQVASGGNAVTTRSRASGDGPSGEDGPVYYSMNFPVSFNDTAYNIPQFSLPAVTSTEPDVTVAVFDTGINPAFIPNSLFYTGKDESCLGLPGSTERNGSKNGWNFIGENSLWRDDHIKRHGTLVTAFIVEQVYKYRKNGIKILPVKTHDGSSGAGDLFKVLCGFSYAADRGAQIINASFGFYAPRYLKSSTVLDSSAFLLKKYIQQYLLPKNILLVAAAGNRDDALQSQVYPLTEPEAEASRNLENFSFYPASLARELPNVIAVNTVNRTEGYCPRQNFSPQVVDIGVHADAGSCGFTIPFSGVVVEGSSFATPIVTGKICAHYYRIRDLLAAGFTKEQIWQRLETDVVNSDLFFEPRTIGGRVAQK